MKIIVTQNDIDLGAPGSYDECPVALAIKRSLIEQGFSYPVVKIRSCYAEIYDNEIALPNEARDFIAAFDYNKEWLNPKPMEFELAYN
jgi:hypothetical protein